MHEFGQDFVLEKCGYFANVGLWPWKQELDPELWLENFQAAEKELAVHLLNSFMYYAEPLVDAIFGAALQSLSKSLIRLGDPLLTSQMTWRTFVDGAIITYVTGETPNPTDSGLMFARKARQRLEFREEQIMDPDAALVELLERGPRPVVFVDDFVGSGRQFLATWSRQVAVGSLSVSFERLSRERGFTFYYCPALCTEYGMNQLRIHTPDVFVNPGHLIPSKYSAIAPDSVIWPADRRDDGREFLRRTSARAGIVAWEGFRRLGLALAFQHSVPDATLPIFYWDKNGWHPLIRRR